MCKSAKIRKTAIQYTEPVIGTSSHLARAPFCETGRARRLACNMSSSMMLGRCRRARAGPLVDADLVGATAAATDIQHRVCIQVGPGASIPAERDETCGHGSQHGSFNGLFQNDGAVAVRNDVLRRTSRGPQPAAQTPAPPLTGPQPPTWPRRLPPTAPACPLRG